MPRRLNLVPPLSVAALEESARPLTYDTLTGNEPRSPIDSSFEPPPENERKLRSSPEAARRRRTLPTALRMSQPDMYSSCPPPLRHSATLAQVPHVQDSSLDSHYLPNLVPAHTSPIEQRPAQEIVFEALSGPSAEYSMDDSARPASPPPPLPAGSPGAASRFLTTAASRPKGLTSEHFRMAVWTYSPKKMCKSTTPSDLMRNRSYLNESLTPDLVGLVFQHLLISELAVASQVCRGWFVSADPWAYVEQHGWVPLGPLTRATRVLLRVSIGDRHVAPELLRCLQFGCEHLTLELGSALAAAAQSFPPFCSGRLSESTPALIRLRSLQLDRPSADDLRLLRERLIPRIPFLSQVSVTRVSLPIGASEIPALVRGTRVRELCLFKVTNLTRNTLQALFAGCPNLAVIRLDQCAFMCDRPRNDHLAPTPPRPHNLDPYSGTSGPQAPFVAGRAAPASKLKVTARIISDAGSPLGFKVLDICPTNRHGPTQRCHPPGTTPSGVRPVVPVSEPCVACCIGGVPCAEHMVARAGDRLVGPLTFTFAHPGARSTSWRPGTGNQYAGTHRSGEPTTSTRSQGAVPFVQPPAQAIAPRVPPRSYDPTNAPRLNPAPISFFQHWFPGMAGSR
jgi:hypothetical protein